MKLQPITYQGHTVAAATAQRFFLADELRSRPPGDPETVFVCYMCAYAREILTARLPGPYTEAKARQFAPAALIPGELLERDQLDVKHAAATLGLPAHKLVAARAAASDVSPDLQGPRDTSSRTPV